MKFGSAVVPVYESRSQGRVRYCFSYYRDGRRLRQFFADPEAAKKEAKFVAQRIQSGMQHVTDLKPHERDSYAKAVELLAELDVPLVAAVEDYVQARKLADGEPVAHPGLHKETTALARALKIRWPRNVLRHSFISYRISIVKSADQVTLMTRDGTIQP